jgi:putative hydrolase of the HAD superfamily
MAAIEAVLFDFAGVFTMSPFTAARDAGADLGITMDQAFALCFGPYEEDTDHPWHRLERGELELAAAHQALKDLALAQGIDADPLGFLSGLGREDDQREAVVERALAVKATGVRTALVTNNVAEFGKAWRTMIPVDDLFDTIVDSCETGVRKPNPAIFRIALDALDVEPEQAVFLDDHPANVAAAATVGIRGIVVGEDRLAAFDELEKLLAG